MYVYTFLQLEIFFFTHLYGFIWKMNQPIRIQIGNYLVFLRSLFRWSRHALTWRWKVLARTNRWLRGITMLTKINNLWLVIIPLFSYIIIDIMTHHASSRYCWDDNLIASLLVSVISAQKLMTTIMPPNTTAQTTDEIDKVLSSKRLPK